MHTVSHSFVFPSLCLTNNGTISEARAAPCCCVAAPALLLPDPSTIGRVLSACKPIRIVNRKRSHQSKLPCDGSFRFRFRIEARQSSFYRSPMGPSGNAHLFVLRRRVVPHRRAAGTLVTLTGCDAAVNSGSRSENRSSAINWGGGDLTNTRNVERAIQHHFHVSDVAAVDWLASPDMPRLGDAGRRSQNNLS